MKPSKVEALKALALGSMAESAVAAQTLSEENNRILRKICAKLGIDPDAPEIETAPEPEAAEPKASKSSSKK